MYAKYLLKIRSLFVVKCNKQEHKFQQALKKKFCLYVQTAGKGRTLNVEEKKGKKCFAKALINSWEWSVLLMYWWHTCKLPCRQLIKHWQLLWQRLCVVAANVSTSHTQRWPLSTLLRDESTLNIKVVFIFNICTKIQSFLFFHFNWSTLKATEMCSNLHFDLVCAEFTSGLNLLHLCEFRTTMYRTLVLYLISRIINYIKLRIYSGSRGI